MKEIIKTNDNQYNLLIDNIIDSISNARNKVAVGINNTIVETYWNIGKYIVEFEQKGEIRAEYGLQLLAKLSKDLTLRLGNGYSKSNLYNIRKLYEYYPAFEDINNNITWTHLTIILGLENDLERQFYINETIKEKWDVRALKRQIKSGLFLRLAASKDKEQILELANKGIEINKPDDIIKDRYVLEFLGMDKENYITEKDLENKIILHLEKFLLELGKGFTFVGRQYHIQVNNRHYYADLVFYHRILKCFVIIDLKVNEVEHEDIGQMNMYMGYFAKDINEPDDNPPIGIILTKHNNEILVDYATYNLESNLFVSKFELYLPNKDDLKRIVENILDDNDN